MNTSNQMTNKYLAHIDILRALAVSLVIFHHLNLPFFNGGFIGVDIFLVISGYLITKNIYLEKTNTGSFSFKSFYQRRVIRLAPAFFTVISACFFFFYLILTHEEWNNFLKTVIASITLTSNIYYWQLLGDYFSIDAKSTPLLHIWSLSLEEQFYLIWPVSLILLLKFGSSFRFIMIFILVLCSVIISHILAMQYAIAAYYLLPSRVFEFCIGAFIALIPYKKFSKKVSYITSIFILATILLASMLINKTSIFPSYTALIPCLSAGFFIYFSYALGNLHFLKPVQYLGKISYPMYLWHWPIIVNLSLLSIQSSLWVNISVLIATIILSILTYELIEKRVKSNFLHKKHIIKSLFILPALFFILLSLITRSSAIIVNNQQYNNKTPPNHIKCIDRSNHPLEECYLGKLIKEKTDILLIGDSHANAQSGFIDYLEKDANLKGYEITYSSTAYLPQTRRYVQDTRTGNIEPINSFYQMNLLFQEKISKEHFKFVIMGGFFPHNWERNIYTDYQSSAISPHLSKKIFISGLHKAIESIIESGATPVLINDNPILRDVNTNCNLRNINNTPCYFNRQTHDEDFKEWNAELQNLVYKYTQLIILDFSDIICDHENCYSSIHDIPLYRDNQHLTYTGSKEIAIEYLKRHENPFK